jgi:hypothetical protein
MCGVALASNAGDEGPDADIAMARNVVAGLIAQGRVAAAGGVVKERWETVGRVADAGGVVKES